MIPEKPIDSMSKMRKRQFAQYFPYLFICLIFASAALNIFCIAGLVGKGVASYGLISVMAGNICNLITTMKDPLGKHKRKLFIWLYIASGLLWLLTYIIALFKA